MRILHIGMMHIRMLFKGESLTLIKVQIQDLSSLILSCRFDGRRQLKFSTCVAFDTAVTRLAAAMFVHYLTFCSFIVLQLQNGDCSNGVSSIESDESSPSSVASPLTGNTSGGSEAATMTEPESLGNCEPGTAVKLQGIVWQETDKGGKKFLSTSTFLFTSGFFSLVLMHPPK